MGEPEGRVLVIGDGPICGVELEEVPSTLQLTDEQMTFLPAELERLRKAGRVVTNGPTYRLESWSVDDERFRLRVSRRSYFDSVLLKRYPEWGVRSRVLATSCILECHDGYVIERRSEKVAALPGRLHLSPSGGIVPPQHPRETVEQEALEELGLEPHELGELGCLGLVCSERVGVFLLVCTAKVNVSHAELERRECSGSWERTALMCVPSDPTLLLSWLEEHRLEITTAGFSALVMEGMRQWGEGWARELLT